MDILTACNIFLQIRIRLKLLENLNDEKCEKWSNHSTETDHILGFLQFVVLLFITKSYRVVIRVKL